MLLGGGFVLCGVCLGTAHRSSAGGIMGGFTTSRLVSRHLGEAYSVAGETWFGWWLVEHYSSYHVDCPDGCGLGEPARGG